MTSKETVLQSLNHKDSGRIPVDFGATSVTGIHCRIVEALRRHYGLEYRPVRIIEPFQMLGEVDEELRKIMGVDVVGIWGRLNMFAIDETRLHEQITPWGQAVMTAEGIDFTPDKNGDVYIYPKGNHDFSPCAIMPERCFFANAVERAGEVDDANLSVSDNLEEYGYITEDDLSHFEREADKASSTGAAVIAAFGGTALGDIAFVPGMGLEQPKGIRSVAEWYMSTVLRQDYIHGIFEKQTDIAVENYRRLWDRLGDKVDVVFTCGTDFGTQTSQFCSVETFNELWLPHYKRMNDWIHKNTSWKIFKHCCGSIIPLIPSMTDAGFDILNPVQINAKDMDSQRLKDEFGDSITFWGGGIDTQKILPSGTPEEIKEHVWRQCEIFGKNGGFVFNAVHNIQANVPIENVIAMIEALNSLRK
ncbi:MAG: methyltransferase [Tannerella sp.]|jgi:uroporphyrinogen-III decarboxylase|nr:methyltransferase [Tannerella sp.]